MKVVVDADAQPAKDVIIEAAKEHSVKVVLVMLSF